MNAPISETKKITLARLACLCFDTPELANWMSSNKIKLNSDNASQFAPSSQLPPLNICLASISARNIGVSFDCDTNFEFQACSICIPASIIKGGQFRMFLDV